MKRNLLIFLFVIGFLVLIAIASAVDFTPQGDIDLMNVYQIKNVTNITAQYYCNSTNCYTAGELYSDGSIVYSAGGVYIYKNATYYFILNDTRLNLTIDHRVATVNSTLAVWIDSKFTRFTEIVGLVGNWTADKVDYYTRTQIDTNLSNYILTSEEGNLNTNSSTWWATVSGFVSKWFYKSGNDMALNETLLNLSIDSRETNCTDEGSCPLITYDTELSYTTDTSAYVNCSTDEVFLGNGSCRSSNAFYDDTTIADSNASTECSGTTTYLDGEGNCDDISGVYIDESALPLENQTISHCSNITGNDSDLCTITDTDTTYTNGSGLSLVGTEFNHTDTSSQASDDNSGNTFIQDIVLDTFGHITSITNAGVDFSSYVAIANLVGYVGNWSDDQDNYYNKTYLYNKTELTNGTWTYYSDEDWINKNSTNAFNFNESKLETTYYLASAIAVVTGTGAGELADIQTYNRTTYNVTESNSDFELRVNFTGITEFTTLLVRHKTSEVAGHVASIQIWDYSDSAWEGYGLLSEEITSTMQTLGVYDSDDHVSGGVVQVRFYQDEGVPNTAHIRQFDWVGISKGYGTPVGTETDPHSIHTDAINDTQMNYTAGKLNILVSFLTGLFYTKAEVDANLSLYRLDSWDNFTGIPTATPSDGDTTHLSTADQIYDWVIGLSYLVAGDIVGLVGNWSADKADYWDATTDLDNVIATDEITELKIDFNTACAAGSHLYVNGNNLACETDDDTTYSAGANLSLDGTTFSLDATSVKSWLDTIYYNSEADLTTLLDDNYEPISAAHFDATTANITCLNNACDWFTNGTDSCMYWPSGGKDCSG